MSNLSSTAATDSTVKTFSDEYTNCTGLRELDLADVYMKMDIGNTDFWGSMSVPWMTCFITYCVLFYGALLVLSSICVCLLFYAAREAYSLLTLMYLLTTYAFWSILSCAQGILIIYSIADNSESSDVALAAFTRNLETITSSCFLGIIIVTFFSHSHSMKVDSKKSDPNLHFLMKANSEKTEHFPLRYAVFSTLVIYLMTILIAFLSTPVVRVRFALSIFVALIIFRLLIFITSVLIVIVGISFKLHSLKAKEQFYSKLLVITFSYLLLSCTHFLYTLATVVNNNNSCMEDIQLHRAVWLTLNSLLRLCEVSFSIVYFRKAVKLVKETLFDNINGKAERDSMSSSFVHQTQGCTRSMFYGFSSDADKPAKPVGFGIHADYSDLEEQQIQVENYRTKRLLATETKHPSHISNSNVEILSQSTSLSPETSSLHRSVDSDRFLDAANFSDSTEMTSNLFDVEVNVIDAQRPVDTEYLVGDIEAEMFDERGGVFHSSKHGVTVIVPAKAIPSGVLAELKFAATLISPVPLHNKKIPVSAIFWLCMDSKVVLQNPIQLRIPMMRLGNKTDALQFAKSAHSTQHDVIGDLMEGLEGGKFIDGESYGSIEIDHFCYYCIMYNNLDRSSIPINSYLLIAMKQRHPSSKDNSWTIDICLVTNLRTCIQYLKDQYSRHGWEHKKLAEFSFEDDYDEVEINLTSNDLARNAARIELLSGMKIKKNDVDFFQYYENNNVEELKNKMDAKQYPPRCSAKVIANHISFFAKFRRITVECSCNGKCSYKGKIYTSCINNADVYGDNSGESDADSKPQRSKVRSSATSGYKSDSSVASLDDEDNLVQGELTIRNVILLTSEIKDVWYKLGTALCIPINIMDKIYGKHNENPMKALNRVYRYWLADEKGQIPTWDGLISALNTIKEYTVATTVKEYTNVSFKYVLASILP